jgi:hypothetical protein
MSHALQMEKFLEKYVIYCKKLLPKPDNREDVELFWMHQMHMKAPAVFLLMIHHRYYANAKQIQGVNMINKVQTTINTNIFPTPTGVGHQ